MDLHSVKSTSKAFVVVMSEIMTATLAVGVVLMFVPGAWASWLNLA